MEIRSRSFPSFDLMRLVAASAVVFSHAFLLANGTEASEPLQQATGEIAGIYGVHCFFIISGFLVTESARRTDTLANFFTKRFLRIFPAFAVANFLVIYGVVAFFLKDPFAFLSSYEALKTYLTVTFLHIDGIYFQNAPMYPGAPQAPFLSAVYNGTLWSIRLEIIGYVLIGVLLFAVPRRWLKDFGLAAIAVIALAGMMMMLGQLTSKIVSQLFFVLPSLCAGIVMNVVVRRFGLSDFLALLSFAILVVTLFVFRKPELFPLFAAYPLIWLGSRDSVMSGLVRRKGDISYGLYLYGWPITQLVRAYAGDGISGYELALFAFPPTVAIAALSWFLLEKPALSLKRASRPPIPDAALADADGEENISPQRDTARHSSKQAPGR